MRWLSSQSTSLACSFHVSRCSNLLFSTGSKYKLGKRPSFVKQRECSAVKIVSPNTSSSWEAILPRRRTGEKIDVAQNFDFLLVLDFEATCCDDGPILPYQEIIEFPVAKLDTSSWTVSSIFHQYVRPTANPNITSFCTHLTGIVQEMVDSQQAIDKVLSDFDDWMKKEELLKSRFAFVTCGDWDLGVMLPAEAGVKNITIPSYFNSWINVKKSYCEHSGVFAKGLRHLLKAYNLTHSGHIHSGIDDVKTICAVTTAIAKEGYVYRINGSTVDDTVPKKLFRNVTV
ncbi:exonuclease [Dictyocaulus viviparus]|uniref:Exonuclease n=1 Tax=Dictyocaulus viviparus TaxID=29172 RepID=A0A0D8YAH6_DICVI|nr:exonuclease [Dictyocaulus viviparus]